MNDRISLGQIYSQATSSVTRNYSRLFLAQRHLLTGKKILRPSDGAAETGRLFGLIRQEENLERYMETAATGRSQLNSGAGALQQLSDTVQRARELAIQGASGSLSASDRATIGVELRELIESIVSSANGKVEDRYLFSGTENSGPPFALVMGADGLEHVVYSGNTEVLDVEIGPGVRASLNIPGSQIFASGSRGATTFLGSTGASSGTSIDSGVGRGRLDVAHVSTAYGGSPNALGGDPITGLAPGSGSSSGDTILGRTHSVTIESDALGNGTISLNGGAPVSFTSADTNLQVTGAGGEVIYVDTTAIAPSLPPTTVSIDSTGTFSLDGGQTNSAIDFTKGNQQVVSSETGDVLHVDATGVTVIGSEAIEYGGTGSLFDALLTIRDALLDTSLEGEKAGDQVRSAVEGLDRAHTDMLRAMSELGARQNRFDVATARLQDVSLTVAELRSNIEDVDIAEATLDISRFETLYQASLMMASRVNELTLLNFI